MKRPSHDELCAAHDRQDWDILWQAAIPITKFAVKSYLRNRLRRTPKWTREDLLQEGLLAAGEAIRTWRTYEAAFSTWLSVKIVSALHNYANRATNHGVGGRDPKDDVAHIYVPEEELPGGPDPLFSKEVLLDDAISKLRDPEERAVIRAYMAGYSCAEIGQQYGRSQDWAERRLSSAKKFAAKRL